MQAKRCGVFSAAAANKHFGYDAWFDRALAGHLHRRERVADMMATAMTAKGLAPMTFFAPFALGVLEEGGRAGLAACGFARL